VTAQPLDRDAEQKPHRERPKQKPLGVLCPHRPAPHIPAVAQGHTQFKACTHKTPIRMSASWGTADIARSHGIGRD
jgi:hypothetical protein